MKVGGGSKMELRTVYKRWFFEHLGTLLESKQEDPGFKKSGRKFESRCVRELEIQSGNPGTRTLLFETKKDVKSFFPGRGFQKRSSESQVF